MRSPSDAVAPLMLSSRSSNNVRPAGSAVSCNAGWLVPNIGHWRYRLWLLEGRFPYIPNSPTDEYHIRYVTAHEGRRLLREAGLEEIALRGHAGTWVAGLYPKVLVNRYVKPTFDRLYEPLVQARPSLFARYLCFYAVKP